MLGQTSVGPAAGAPFAAACTARGWHSCQKDWNSAVDRGAVGFESSVADSGNSGVDLGSGSSAGFARGWAHAAQMLDPVAAAAAAAVTMG